MAELELAYTVAIKHEAVGVTSTVMTEFIDKATGKRVTSPPELLGGNETGTPISVDYIVGDFFNHYREIKMRQ